VVVAKEQVRLPKGWRPLSAEQLQARVNTYLELRRGHPQTKAGLAFFLDLERAKDLDTLAEFPRYGKAIRQGLLRMEDRRASDLADPTTKNARGIEFDLCNNFGWVDAKKVSLEDNRARVLRLPKRKPVGAPVGDVKPAGEKKAAKPKEEPAGEAAPAEAVAEAASA
jgi:hypothetical protein